MLAAMSKGADIVARVERGESVRKVASSLGIPLSTAYYHARDHCRKQSRMEIERLALKERGYLLGITVGDGSLIRNTQRGEFLVKIALDGLRDRDISHFLSSLFEKCGKRVSVHAERRMVILRIWSRSFYSYVLEHVRFEKEGSSRHHMRLLLDVNDWDRGFTIGFIGGLIDSDGHIQRGKRNGHYGAMITTSSASLGDQVRDLCKAQHINVLCRLDRRGKPDERPRYIMRIPSGDLNSLCSELLCMKHARYHGGPGRI